MNKSECEIGMKIKVAQYDSTLRHRKTGTKPGVILKLYDTYALIDFEIGYKECHPYMDILKDE